MNILDIPHYVWQLLALVIALYHTIIWSTPPVPVSKFTFSVLRWG